MSRVKDYEGKCATCNNYALGSKSQLKPGVGFRCFKYGEAKSMSDHCNSHLIMAGYDFNRKVTDKDILDAEKMINATPGCFITTIVVDILGKPDNCNALEILRKFRSEVMQPNKQYHAYLNHYDTIGPQIARNIENDLNKMEVAKTAYENYILPVCALVLNQRNDEAINLYIEMTNILAHMYQIENTYDYNVCYSLDEAKLAGHGRKLKKTD